MLKLIYTTIKGGLVADISSVSPLLPVDYDTYSAIAAAVDFAGGEWTYLRMDNGVYTEEVKVTGLSVPNLIVERGKSGSIPQPFSADTTVVTNIMGADAITDVVAQSTPSLPFNLNSTGIAEVTHVDADYNIHVASPNFLGEDGIEIMGVWPNITFGLALDAGGCCGDGGGGGSAAGGVATLNITSTILQGSIAGDTLNLALQAPNFQGVGVEITGAWPDLTFTVTGGAGGTGTVTEVAVGGGLTITGNPNVNPVVSLTATGVTPGNYGGLGINVFGQIDNIPAGFNPISSINFSGLGTVSRVGAEAVIVLQDADIGQKGVVSFADHTGVLDTGADNVAATPAYVAAAIGGNINEAAGSSTGEADAAYTNILSGTAINVQLAAGEKALVQGMAIVLNDATPGTPYEYGLAVFDAGSVKRIANKKCTQSNQTLMGVLTGPLGPTTISLVTTDIAAGNTLQSSFLSLIKI